MLDNALTFTMYGIEPYRKSAWIKVMRKFTAYVSGRIQESGYRSKVVTIARAFGIRGFVKNLADGRVKVLAEGEESDLERFAKALVMKNTLIDVTGLEKQYAEPTGIFDDFDKIVGEGETDARLDTAAHHLKTLICLTEKSLDKQDQMLGKQDQMLGKQDELIGKMDETKEEIVGEIRDLRSDLKTSLDDRLSRIESDVAQIKAKVGLGGR
jgi:acylphosphatase